MADHLVKADHRIRRKHCTASLSTKMAILKELDNGVTPAVICKTYGMPRSTVYDIVRNREKIEHFVKTENSGWTRKRHTMKMGVNPELENDLYAWFLEQRRNDIPVTGNLLREKALSLHEEMSKDKDQKEKVNFRASEGWLGKFKDRFGIRMSKRKGAEATSEAVLILNYDPTSTEESNEDDVNLWLAQSAETCAEEESNRDELMSTTGDSLWRNDSTGGGDPLCESSRTDDADSLPESSSTIPQVSVVKIEEALSAMDTSIRWAEENSVDSDTLLVMYRLRHDIMCKMYRNDKS